MLLSGGDANPLADDDEVATTAENALRATVTDFDTAEVDLIHPGLTVEQVCLTDPVPVGAKVEFRITIEDPGDVALVITTHEVEFPGPFALDAGVTFYELVFRPGDGGGSCYDDDCGDDSCDDADDDKDNVEVTDLLEPPVMEGGHEPKVGGAHNAVAMSPTRPASHSAPNRLSGDVRVHFGLPKNVNVPIDVCDVAGRLVARLENGQKGA